MFTKKRILVIGFLAVAVMFGYLAIKRLPPITVVDSLPVPSTTISKPKQPVPQTSDEEENLQQTKYTVFWRVPRDVYEVVIEYRDHSNSVVFSRKFSVTPEYSFRVEGKRSDE